MVIQSFSQLYRHSHGPYKNLKALINHSPKMERKNAFRDHEDAFRVPECAYTVEDIRIFVEAVCAGPGHENACRGRAGARPANDSAVEAVRVLLKAVRVLLKAVRVLVKAVRVGELC